MASHTTLKLTSRSPRQPVKRLPATIDLPAEATVEDAKKAIAKQCGISDFNRIGLFDPTSKKTLKNRKALITEETAVIDAGELIVKDLGLQIPWRTVFVIEYLGPLLIHGAAVLARPLIYKDNLAKQAMSSSQWLSFGMIMGHFVKRELETLFVHKFSANTMPARNIFKNSFFYWAFSGALCAWSIYYSPWSLAARADELLIDAVGTALYLFGEIGNALVHLYLSSLRSAGGTERQIPHGYGFSLVTCPNYMYEVLSWVGIIVASRDWAVVLFITMGAAQMFVWAKGKEKAYRQEFGDKYKRKRYVLLPGLL